MKKLRRFLAIVLLLNFVVLLTPRDWWHDCHHEHEHEHAISDNSPVQFDQEEDCFICDYHLGYHTITSFFSFSIISVFLTFLVLGTLALSQKERSPYFSLRAPPLS